MSVRASMAQSLPSQSGLFLKDGEFTGGELLVPPADQLATQSDFGSSNGAGAHHSDSGEFTPDVAPIKSGAGSSADLQPLGEAFNASETVIAAQFAYPMPPAQLVQTRAEQPLRSSPGLPDETAPHAPVGLPVRQMGVLIRGAGDQVVRLQISQANGSVRVAAHSDDESLGEHIRASLPDLVDRLGRQGYSAVTSSPSQNTGVASHHSPSKDLGSETYRDSTADQQQRHQRQRAMNAWQTLATQLHDS